MKESLWWKQTLLPEFAPLNQDLHTDVLIIGGGLTGILCAWKLAQSGVDYALIEADRICSGITRNTTAKITSQHGLIYHKILRQFGKEQTRRYWEINEAALQEYAALSQSVACDFERQDSYVYSIKSPTLLEEELEVLQQLKIPAEYVRETALPFSTVGAIRFRNQAQFDPIKFVLGICNDLRIYEHTQAREFIKNTVITNRGKITASKVIMATHFPILNKHGGYFLKLYQQRSYVLALQKVAPIRGMYLAAEENGLSFREAGGYLLLGGGGHRTGKQGGGWDLLKTFATQYYPESKEVFQWATQDCMTLDGVPYIGQYSRRTPSLFVATGFNKWGMTSAMASAAILSDLIQGKHNPYADMFSPERSLLRRQFFMNAGEAAFHLLKPTKPRCPHLGCALQWNKQEHSWDCPCHGSRFTKQGTLLNNPATGNLEVDKK